MSFKSTVKGHELAFVSKLLAIFGAVEERQMRQLFSHLNDGQYGKIMTRMDREGLFYRTPEAKYLTSTRALLDKVNIQASVACFWAFLELKDRVRDFCVGEMPAVITMAAKASDYDLIPVTEKNTQLINDSAEDLPEATVRFLVTRDLNLLTQIERRMKNDYAILVDDNGVVETYEL